MDKAAPLGHVVDHVKEQRQRAKEASKISSGVPSEIDEVIVDQIEDGSEQIKSSIRCDDRPELFAEIGSALKALEATIIMPGVFKSLEIIQGDHDEVGRIKIVTFSPETQIKAAKHRTEAIDEVNYKYKYSLIEGSILGDDLESITYDINVENGENDVVSVMTFVTTYRPKGDNHHSILEKVKQSQERTEGFVRAIEAYILANPFKYNI
ncbi:hypothetical protein SASPL_112588 [Salvia splendens]|uniref:Bet v I/Major latex protein domain-containing protein n=1 Tax=Salvia splendens TaxID=180675 RepID=A0A8X9A4C6_SALSN|nr:hypothetical protein SASPL_112588 [Salvia splendens]